MKTRLLIPFIIAVMSIIARGGPTITFDELPEQPADGLTVKGVTFHSTVTGRVVDEQFHLDYDRFSFNRGGKLVGAGVVGGGGPHNATLTFFAPVNSFSFDFEIFTHGLIPETVIMTVSGPGLPVPATLYLFPSPIASGFAHKLVSFSEVGISQVRLDVVLSASGFELPSFSIDNLTYSPGSDEPTCELSLDSYNYSTGQIVKGRLKLVNPSETSRPVEMKSWFVGPTGAVVSLVNLGADGSVVLSPFLSSDPGFIDFFHVSPDSARGSYRLGFRLLDPITGDLIAESLASFQVAQ